MTATHGRCGPTSHKPPLRQEPAREGREEAAAAVGTAQPGPVPREQHSGLPGGGRWPRRRPHPRGTGTRDTPCPVRHPRARPTAQLAGLKHKSAVSLEAQQRVSEAGYAPPNAVAAAPAVSEAGPLRRFAAGDPAGAARPAAPGTEEAPPGAVHAVARTRAISSLSAATGSPRGRVHRGLRGRLFGAATPWRTPLGLQS